MQLDSQTARIRPRRSWEAMDLGVRLVQANFSAIYKPWLLVVLPTSIAIHALLWRHPAWAMITVWWLNPLFAHIPLVVLSRRLFGETPRTRQTLRLTRQALGNNWLAWLTLRRLSFRRSFVMPVSVLEGLRGQDRNARIRVLAASKDGSDSIALTFICWCMVVAILASIIGFVELMHAPTAAHMFDWSGQDAPYWLLLRHLLDGGSVLLAWLIVEPLFVACGFALYLNRRTHLEGWDIELGLRTMATRLTAQSGHDDDAGQATP